MRASAAGDPLHHRLASGHAPGGSFAGGPLLGRHPLLGDADALHRHVLGAGAEPVAAGHRQVVDADAEHRVGQLTGGTRRLGGARWRRRVPTRAVCERWTARLERLVEGKRCRDRQRAGSRAAARATARRTCVDMEGSEDERERCWHADTPHQRRSVDGAGQTRSLSVERKSGSGGGRASAGAAQAGRLRASRDQGQLEHLDDGGQRTVGSLTASKVCARVGGSAGGTATGCCGSMPSHGRAGRHHGGHRLDVMPAAGRRIAPAPAARTATTAPRRTRWSGGGGDGAAWAGAL